MSLQRILGIARQQKSPLIVTDVAGREPFVILPMEEYERLLKGRSSSSLPAELKQTPEVEVMIESSTAKMMADPPSTAAPGTPISLRDFDQVEESAPEGEGLSIEERFYLEPMDDEKN